MVDSNGLPQQCSMSKLPYRPPRRRVGRRAAHDCVERGISVEHRAPVQHRGHLTVTAQSQRSHSGGAVNIKPEPRARRPLQHSHSTRHSTCHSGWGRQCQHLPAGRLPPAVATAPRCAPEVPVWTQHHQITTRERTDQHGIANAKRGNEILVLYVTLAEARGDTKGQPEQNYVDAIVRQPPPCVAHLRREARASGPSSAPELA